ncbi:hypothetical protein B0H11DRAFT_1909488 [Mycena galericulata]|nr:hypothetical protein B0H11DRAFT_1909488 [Mycena galericulata]
MSIAKCTAHHICGFFGPGSARPRHGSSAEALLGSAHSRLGLGMSMTINVLLKLPPVGIPPKKLLASFQPQEAREPNWSELFACINVPDVLPPGASLYAFRNPGSDQMGIKHINCVDRDHRELAIIAHTNLQYVNSEVNRLIDRAR